MSVDPAAFEPLAETRLFLGEEMTRPLSLTLGGGEAVVFTAPRAGARINEDGAAVIPIGEHSCVLLVADGVGGGNAGDVAARLLLESVAEEIDRNGSSAPSVRNAILDGIESANQAILGLDVRASTTVAAVEISGSRLRTYHAGDSMVALFGDGGQPRWKTVSHAPVGYALASGFFTERQAIRHGSLHLLSNAVGSSSMRLELGNTPGFQPNDTLLLGSDGLFDNLMTREIGEILSGRELRAVVAELVETAAGRMASPSPEVPSKPDDLTVLVFRPHDQEALGTLSFEAVKDG